MTFSAGGVLGRAFILTIQNFVTFFVLALIVSAPVHVLGHFLQVEDVISVDPGVRIEEHGLVEKEPSEGSLASGVVVWMLSVIAQDVLAGMLAYGVFQALRGQRPGVGACLSRGFARFLPIVLISIVFVVCVSVGVVLLIVPGLMIVCAWYVAVPVTAVEHLGVGPALQRSADLTRGYRWSIFGMFVLLVFLQVLVGAGLVGVFSVLDPTGARSLSLLVSVLLSLYGGVVGAVAYHDLRITKEGVTTDELVKAFE